MAEDEGALTSGIPDAIANAQTGKMGYLQVASIQPPKGGKYTFELSDGIKKIKCIVGTALSRSFQNDELIPGTVVQIFKYVPTAVAGKQTAIITKMEIIQKECEMLLQDDNKPLVALSPPAKAGGNPNFGSSISKSSGAKFGSISSGSSGNTSYMPIASLSPYMSNNWKVKARCIQKRDVNTWNKASGSGKLFSFVLQDDSGKQIRVTAFNEEVDKFFTTIVEDKVYIISKGRIKSDNKYKGAVDNDYSMTLSRDSSVDLVEEDAGFAQRTFNFVPIGNLEQYEENQFVDICAAVQSVSEIQQFTSKAGKELRKRNITLIDESNAAVDCTIWAALADKYTPENLSENTIVVVPGCRVSHFNGRSLSANSILVDQNNEATQRMQKWVSSGPTAEIKTLSVRGARKSDKKLTWEEAAAQNMGRIGEKGDYFDLIGTITQIPANMEKPPWYKACPEVDGKAESNAKVEEDGNGKWICHKIGKTFDSYTPRFVLRLNVQDPTGSQYCASYNDIGEEVLHMKCAEIEKHHAANDEDSFNECFRSSLWQKHRFTIRARLDNYQDEERVRYDVVRIQPIDYVSESQELLQKLQAL